MFPVLPARRRVGRPSLPKAVSRWIPWILLPVSLLLLVDLPDTQFASPDAATTSPAPSNSLEQTIGAFLLITAVLMLLPAALKRVSRVSGQRSAGGKLEILDSLSLDRRRRILLVRVRGEDFLLGASEAGLQRLGQLARPDRTRVEPERFQDILEATS